MPRPEKNTKQPASERLSAYLRKLTILLSVISLMLLGLFVLIPGERNRPADRTENPGSGELPDFEPEYQDLAEDSSTGLPADQSGQSDPASDPGTGTADSPPDGPSPVLSIVIDDAGYNMEGLKPFLDLDIPLTVAVLPQLQYSKESSRQILEAGHELILHLPMESKTGRDPGPGTISTSMNDAEIIATLRTNTESVPGLVGINNHMGSKGTEDPRLVREVLEFARAQSLLFLDSKTTSASVVPLMAQAIEIPIVQRDVFLDNEKDAEAIISALETGMEIALKQGYAVLIGHVWTTELAAILEDQAPSIIERGFTFQTLSSVFRRGN